MKRIVVFFTLLISLLLSACAPKGEFRYNDIDLSVQGAPPYIEGTYTLEITAEEFEAVSGMMLPEYAKGDCWAHYDGEDEILNMRVNTKNGENDIYISLFSQTLWSERSYSPVDYVYDSRTKVTKVEEVEVTAGYCKGSSLDMDKDIYTAKFTLNEVGIDVEMHTNDRAVFETFIKDLILNNK